jgi:hypothetical protein
VRSDLPSQPVTVGGVNDPGDKTFDGELYLARRAGTPTAQEALNGAQITAVVDEVGKRGRIGRQ